MQTVCVSSFRICDAPAWALLGLKCTHYVFVGWVFLRVPLWVFCEWAGHFVAQSVCCKLSRPEVHSFMNGQVFAGSFN